MLRNNEMTEVEFDKLFDDGMLDEEYAEYIMEHSAGDRIICNGDTLLDAMEDLYPLDSFKDNKVTV